MYVYIFDYIVVPQYPQGIGSRTLMDAKILGCSGPSYNMAWYLHITYTPPPINFKSSPDYL